VIHHHPGHPTIQATFPLHCDLLTSTLHYSTKKQYLLNLITCFITARAILLRGPLSNRVATSRVKPTLHNNKCYACLNPRSQNHPYYQSYPYKQKDVNPTCYTGVQHTKDNPHRLDTETHRIA